MSEWSKGATRRPYLTIVGWTRNDGYTANYAERITHAIGLLVRQLEAHQIPSELVVVEWNPPVDCPRISDLVGPLNTRETTVRFVEVGEEHHRRLKGWKERGLPTVAALSVGIRRARGVFLTPKALDTFYSHELIARIAKQDLNESCVYRVDRCDVQIDGDAWLGASDEELFELLLGSPMQRHVRQQQSPQWKIRDLHTNGCGDFTLLSTERWHLMRGYPEDTTVLGLDADSIALHAAAGYGAREVCWPDECAVYKIVQAMTHNQRVSPVWKSWQHSLDRWLLELNQRDLGHRIRMLLDYPKRRVLGIESVLAPSIERNFVARATRFARNDVSRPMNDANWGLGDVQLPERVVSRASWDAN
ncbi:MAG: hypothetical protein ACT4O6_06525 [Reyranella sp.]